MSIQSVQNLKTQLEASGTTLSDFMLESMENVITIMLMFANIQDDNVGAGLEEVLPPEAVEEIVEEVEEEAANTEAGEVFEVVTSDSTPQYLGEFDLEDGEAAVFRVETDVVYVQNNQLYQSFSHRTRGVQKWAGKLALARARWGDYLTWNRYAFYGYYRIHDGKVKIYIRGRNGLKVKWRVRHTVEKKLSINS